MTGGWLFLTLFSTLGCVPSVPAPGCPRPPDIDTCHTCQCCHQPRHRGHQGRIGDCHQTGTTETPQTEKIKVIRARESLVYGYFRSFIKLNINRLRGITFFQRRIHSISDLHSFFTLQCWSALSWCPDPDFGGSSWSPFSIPFLCHHRGLTQKRK